MPILSGYLNWKVFCTLKNYSSLNVRCVIVYTCCNTKNFHSVWLIPPIKWSNINFVFLSILEEVSFCYLFKCRGSITIEITINNCLVCNFNNCHSSTRLEFIGKSYMNSMHLIFLTTCTTNYLCAQTHTKKFSKHNFTSFQ